MAYTADLTEDVPLSGEYIRLGASRIATLADAVSQRLASTFVDPDADPMVLKDASVATSVDTRILNKIYPVLTGELGVTNQLYNYGDPYRYGAKFDGATDDTAAWNYAVAGAALADKILRPTALGGSSRVTAKIPLTTAIRVVGYMATILMDFPVATSTADGAVFIITGSNVTVEGLTIDGGNIAGVITGVNRYGIITAPVGLARISNVVVRNCAFTNMVQASGALPNTTTVMHAIYMRNVDRPVIKDCIFANLSGSALYLSNTTRAIVSDCDVSRFGWSGMVVHDTNYNWSISRCQFWGTTAANPSYWGGAIDVMGQTSDQVTPGSPNENGLIEGCKFIGGVYRYGQVLRLSSALKVAVKNCIFDQCDAENSSNIAVVPGSSGAGGQNNMITVTVRDITLNNGPSKNIIIEGCHFIAKGAGWQKAIYAITTSGSNTNTTAAEGLHIKNNQFISPDALNFWLMAVSVHGFAAGYNDIIIEGNTAKGQSNATPNYVPGSLPGLIAIVTNAGKTCKRVHVRNNNLEFYGASGGSNNDNGVYIGQDVDAIVVNNEFLNFFRSITVHASAGVVPVLTNTHRLSVTAGSSAYNWRGAGFTPTTGGLGTAVTADQSITNNLGPVNVTELKIPIGPNETVLYRFTVDVGAALATTGLQVWIAVPAGIVSTSMRGTLFVDNTTLNQQRSAGAGPLTWPTAALAGATNGTVEIVGRVVSGATGGFIQLQFGQQVSVATALTVKANSFQTAERL